MAERGEKVSYSPHSIFDTDIHFRISFPISPQLAFTCSNHKKCPGLRELSLNLPWAADRLSIGGPRYWPHHAAKSKNVTCLLVKLCMDCKYGIVGQAIWWRRRVHVMSRPLAGRSRCAITPLSRYIALCLPPFPMNVCNKISRSLEWMGA